MVPEVKIYTKSGDEGETGLLGGSRVGKTELRIVAIGEVDELNAAIGLARTVCKDPLLELIQCWLFDLGAELACPVGGKFEVHGPGAKQITELEASMDEMATELAPLKQFILPGGTEAGARLHLARSICRRTERAVLALNQIEPVSGEARVFLNRLSDWLFLAARTENAHGGVLDVTWRKTEAN